MKKNTEITVNIDTDQLSNEMVFALALERIRAVKKILQRIGSRRGLNKMYRSQLHNLAIELKDYHALE